MGVILSLSVPDSCHSPTCLTAYRVQDVALFLDNRIVEYNWVTNLDLVLTLELDGSRSRLQSTSYLEPYNGIVKYNWVTNLDLVLTLELDGSRSRLQSISCLEPNNRIIEYNCVTNQDLVLTLEFDKSRSRLLSFSCLKSDIRFMEYNWVKKHDLVLTLINFNSRSHNKDAHRSLAWCLTMEFWSTTESRTRTWFLYWFTGVWWATIQTGLIFLLDE